MTYTALRELADSWGLVAMGVLFVTFIGWTFRPGAGRDHAEASQMIFQDDDTFRGDDHDQE